MTPKPPENLPQTPDHTVKPGSYTRPERPPVAPPTASPNPHPAAGEGPHPVSRPR